MKHASTPCTVINLGGSIVVPENIDTDFIASFQKTIINYTKKGNRCIIVVGGGKTCRRYQEAARAIEKLPDELLDWIGIRATHLNATLLQSIFHSNAHSTIVTNPKEDAKNWNSSILISGGWKPGWSTDYVAALLAHRFRAERVIIATNIDYVYSADIKKDPKAKPYMQLSWKEYREIIPSTWTPGLSTPVDPIAAKYSEEHQILTHLLNGNDIKNFQKCLARDQWKGTTIG